jgi:hypothetical protein
MRDVAGRKWDDVAVSEAFSRESGAAFKAHVVEGNACVGLAQTGDIYR